MTVMQNRVCTSSTIGRPTDECGEKPWVIGPTGQKLTMDDLPRPQTQRWVPHRKAEVVAAVHGGLLTVDEALQRYNLTIEEFSVWQRAIGKAGLRGLPISSLQKDRDSANHRGSAAVDWTPPGSMH